jgi:hypothetical protein
MTNDQLGHIINQTLESHRFVVLPEVGAFLLRSIPARINAVQDRIDPPKDVIRFNTAIKEDDGLLTTAIAKFEGIERTDAELSLKDVIGRIQFSLGQKETVSLGPIGFIKVKADRTLVFEQSETVQVWPSHFGLPTFQLQALSEEKKVSIRNLVPNGKVLAREFPVKKIVGYAAALAVVVSLGIIPLADENNRHMAALSFASFVGNPVDVRYTSRTFEPLEVSAAFISEEPKHRTESVKEIPVKESKALLNKELPLETETLNAAIAEATEYFVIAGAFAEKSNADKLIADLSARGFGGTYVGRFDGKHLVSYGNYSSLKDAKGMKASVQLGNPDAWVLAGR